MSLVRLDQDLQNIQRSLLRLKQSLVRLNPKQLEETMEPIKANESLLRLLAGEKKGATQSFTFFPECSMPKLVWL